MPVENSVTVTAGSDLVEGYLTQFVAVEGDTFMLNGLSVEILAQETTARLRLRHPWPGVSLTDQTDWTILRTSPYWSTVVTTNSRITDLIQRLEEGLPLKPEAFGTLADRALYDDRETGFMFMQIDVDPFLIYVKRSSAVGDWTPGQALRGADGAQLEFRVDPGTYELQFRRLGEEAWTAVIAGDLDVIVGPYRADAEQSATAAAQSANEAATSASNSQTSANASAASASAALTSENNAAASASAAQASETNSASSAAAALASQDAARSSETNAASSASAAATSETNARTSETNAASSAGIALDHRNAAAASADSAASSASAALTSQNNAATSASNAASSASAAAASETNASTSASAAATSELNAANSATASAASASKADQWANSAENVEVEPGKYSAFHWAAKAQTFATGESSNISFTPYGNIGATNVQGAIEELETEKAPLAHAHVIADVTDLQAALDTKVDKVVDAARYWRVLFVEVEYGYLEMREWRLYDRDGLEIRGGTITGSSTASATDYPVTNLRDQTNSLWITAWNQADGSWAMLDFGEGGDKDIGSIRLLSHTDATRKPSHIKLQRSSDGVTFTDAGEWTGLTWASGEEKTFTVPPPTVASASEVSFTPSGNLSATNVQGALAEMDAEKAPFTHTHPWSQITDTPQYYPPSAHDHIIGDVTGLQAALDAKAAATKPTFIGSGTVGSGTTYLGALEVRGDGAGAAMIAFHRPGAYAEYFGLDSDNVWAVGGWSRGAVRYPILHTGNFSSYYWMRDVSHSYQTVVGGGTWENADYVLYGINNSSNGVTLGLYVKQIQFLWNGTWYNL